jgi:hypothetical protein
MSNDKTMIFPEGIRVFAPGDNAPGWIKGQILLNKNELIQWLRTQENEVRLDIKQSKKGSWYMSVSDFTPQEKGFFKKSDFPSLNNPTSQDGDLPF